MDKKIFEFVDEDLKKDKMGGKYSHQWVEDSFNLEKKQNEKFGLKTTSNYIGKTLNNKKIKIFFFFIILGLSIIFLRIFQLQVIKGEENRILAENNRIRIKPIPPERGVFYDLQNQELVQNIPSFSLVLIPQELPRNVEERWNLIQKIALATDVTPEEINEKIKRYSPYYYEKITIKENLDYDSAIKIYTKNKELPGITIESDTKRKYVLNNDGFFSLSHLLGYVGKLSPEELEELSKDGYYSTDNIGKAGLEKYYEKDLRGIYGKKKIEVNVLGKEQDILSEDPPGPGNNLYLSIDAEAQKKLEEILQKKLEEIGKKRGVAIALNPQNGEILAMISLPAYNDDDFSGGISYNKYQEYLENKNQPLFNRVIGGTYPSGSIIKPIMAVAALEEDIITLYTTFLSTGGLQINKWFFPDWQAGGHGVTDVKKAIAWSVNTFFYYIGGGYKNFEGLGVDKIIEYLKKFNLGQRTGIDLPGERSGFLPSAEWKKETKGESWYIGDTYNLSIGQGDLLVTPLQAAVWTATVANGGKIVVPHLVRQIEDTKTKEIIKIEPQIINENFVSAQNINIAKQGMKQCVTDGSCKILQSIGTTSGGKTGTAQWSATKDNHAWFTSFAPYNTPQIVVTILIEEGGGGATNAMPVARDFLYWWQNIYKK